MKSRLAPDTTKEIQQLLQGFVSTWNAKNLHGFLENFVEDAEFTDVVNQTAIGKAAIGKQHEFAFNVVMKNASLEISNLLMREILPEVVMVTANWFNTGSQTPTGQSLPDRNGVIQFIIIRQESSEWKLKLVHNADFSLPYERRDTFIE